LIAVCPAAVCPGSPVLRISLSNHHLQRELKLAKIITTRGPINPSELGFTSMHEHTLFDARFMRKRYEAFLPEDGPVKPEDPLSLSNLGILKHGFILSNDLLIMKDEALITEELADFKAMGGSAVVDMSSPGLRVDPLSLQRISQDSDVHVVAPTGFYSRDSWPERFWSMTVDAMIEFMRGEIDHGIDETEVMPGHVKIAVDDKTLEDEVNALRAGIRVAGETGYSLTVHQGMLLEPEDGIWIADIIKEEGLDMSRVVIAHNDAKCASRILKELILNPKAREMNLTYALELLDRGANLSVDCFGHYWDAEALGFTNINDWQRIVILKELIEAGYEDQLVIGTDTFIKFLLRRYGGEGYCRLLVYTVPILKEIGIPEDTIYKITTANPARILAC